MPTDGDHSKQQNILERLREQMEQAKALYESAKEAHERSVKEPEDEAPPSAQDRFSRETKDTLMGLYLEALKQYNQYLLANTGAIRAAGVGDNLPAASAHNADVPPVPRPGIPPPARAGAVDFYALAAIFLFSGKNTGSRIKRVASSSLTALPLSVSDTELSGMVAIKPVWEWLTKQGLAP